MTALPSHPRFEPAATPASGEYHAPDDVLPCGMPAGVALLAGSAASVRVAAFLTLDGASDFAWSRFVGAGAAALAGIIAVVLSYVIARRVTAGGRESVSQLAGLTSATLAAFWPTQIWPSIPHAPGLAGVDCATACLNQPGLALLAAAAAWLAGPSLLARLGLAGALLWATTIHPIFAALLPVAVLLTLGSGSLLQRVVGFTVVSGAAGFWVWWSESWTLANDWSTLAGILPPVPQIQFELAYADSTAAVGLSGIAVALALLGTLSSTRRRRPTLLGVSLLLVGVAHVALDATDWTTAWAMTVEPLILPTAALFVASRIGRWALPRERPILVQRYLSTHRPNQSHSHRSLTSD